MMDKDYISRVAESKTEYHKQKAKMSFEEKLKILIEFQRLDIEMLKNNKRGKTNSKLRMVWQID